MRISALNTVSAPFGRRLTRKEQHEKAELEMRARNALGINTTSAVVFDTSLPKDCCDTGIGTTFSNEALKAASFLKSAAGINAWQLGPQGQISQGDPSPYLSTSFSLGMHLIDLKKLTYAKYGKLLSPNDLKAPFFNTKPNPSCADYNNIFGSDGQKAVLKKAYDKFVLLSPDSKIKQDFEKFKAENDYWLEKDALYEAAAAKFKTNNMLKWPHEYQNTFAEKSGNKRIIEELKNTADDEGRNIVDFEEFIQFTADMQQKEAKEKFNQKGILLFGDCQLGFSQKDIWAHKSAFYDNLDFGCDGQCWSRAFDFNKLNGDAGELLYNKFNLFFKRYNGARIDAAWQLIKPMLLEPLKNPDGSDKFDDRGNKLGVYKESNQPPNQYGNIIDNIVMKAASDNGVPRNRVYLEMLGSVSNIGDAMGAALNSGAQLIHITRYGHNNNGGWGSVRFYEQNQHFKPGQYTIGCGTHDDTSLISQSETEEYRNNRTHMLADYLKLNEHELWTDRGRWRDAAFAELFTTHNQFMTMPDLLGEDRRINEPGKPEGSWAYRMTPDFRERYYRNLEMSRGFNQPDALSKALNAKGLEPDTARALAEYAAILRAPED